MSIYYKTRAERWSDFNGLMDVNAARRTVYTQGVCYQTYFMKRTLWESVVRAV